MSVASASVPPSTAYTPSWAENPVLQLRKTVLGFLQGLFEEAEVSCFRWHESLEDTEIVITDEFPLKLDVVGKRPAITLVRGAMSWNKTSIGEMLSLNMANDQKKRSDLVSGTISINCCARDDLESEYIALIVARHLWILGPLLQKGTPIHEIGRGVQLGSPSPAGAIVVGDTEGEWINTPVTTPYFIQETNSVQPLGQQLLRRLSLRLGVRGGAQVGNTPVRYQARQTGLRQPTIRGRPIRNVSFEQTLVVTDEENPNG